MQGKILLSGGASGSAGAGPGLCAGENMFYVIISRHCATMQQELAPALQGRKDVRVILDRRFGERRVEQKPITPERRRAQRRRPSGELSSN